MAHSHLTPASTEHHLAMLWCSKTLIRRCPLASERTLRLYDCFPLRSYSTMFHDFYQFFALLSFTNLQRRAAPRAACSHKTTTHIRTANCTTSPLPQTFCAWRLAYTRKRLGYSVLFRSRSGFVKAFLSALFSSAFPVLEVIRKRRTCKWLIENRGYAGMTDANAMPWFMGLV